ncbi:MAG TPA: histidine--tRNA ligase [Candidatus Latescibacteria bacterium]|nr:histidine--tRNA ligase [Candidatus Latescibacterota bacterium]
MASALIEPRVLRGFRDYLPEEMIPRQRMINTITAVFERQGFAPLGTPALEYSEVLLGKYGADAEKLLFRFTDNGGRDVSLRYDLTLSLARVAAQYGNLPVPFKRYQIAPVWRAERPGHGRFREFYQCDVDIVGAAGPLAEYECIQVDYDVMTALGIEKFSIHVSNRKLLEGLSSKLGVSDSAQSRAIARTIDKLPSQGEGAVRALLFSDAGLNSEQIGIVFEYLSLKGSNEAILAQLREFFANTPEAHSGIESLEAIIRCASAAGIPESTIELDLSIARGLDYYTGTVYETFLLDLPALGSVMSGGRYDGLVAIFTGQDVPAVGISVGIDRLFSGLQETGRIPQAATVSQVLVTVFNESTTPQSLQAATRLRSLGVAAEVAVEGGALRRQLKYANKQHIPFALIIGPDEAENGTMTLRDMESGEQESFSTVEAVAARVLEQRDDHLS